MHQEINRRVLLSASAALMSVGAAGSGTASDASLDTLIARHRAASAEFDDAIEREDEISAAYEAARKGKEAIIPCFLGGGISDAGNGEKQVATHIREAYCGFRNRSLKHLARMSPELAEAVAATTNQKEAENLALVERHFAERRADEEAFGLTAARQRREDASKGEEEALLAVLAHPCRTTQEAARKADYLLTALEGSAHQLAEIEGGVDALLRSMLIGRA